MRILCFANNWVGWQVVQWLRDRDEEIVGVVVHPPGKRKYGEEIIQSSGVDSSRILDGSRLRDPQTMDIIGALAPDIGVSAFFGYILPPRLLDLFPKGCINIHPSYLPFNRGAHPNVWSILDETPSGVTLHYMDAGIDTGDIIAQRQVPVTPVDTGETLYRRLERECVRLFQETWPFIRAGKAPRRPQEHDKGTYHRVHDVQRIDRVELDATYRARDLINLIRARTFPPHPGAYFIHDGRKVYLRLQLTYEDEDATGSAEHETIH